jgi:hypothetical protein
MGTIIIENESQKVQVEQKYLSNIEEVEELLEALLGALIAAGHTYMLNYKIILEENEK